MVSAKYRYNLLILLLLPVFWFLADAQAYGNFTVGDFLVANDENRTWVSPSGDFAFGFVPYLGGEQQFLLSIWLDKISDKTVVWSANRDTPADRGSRVELSSSGKLVLSSSNGRELWSSSGGTETESLQAAMLDTGNFVVTSGNSSIIWESFLNPTDTILPTQDLGVGASLTSMLSERSCRIGNFQLRFSNGQLGLFQIDKFSGKPFRPYYNISDGSRLIFNQSGHIMVMRSNGNMVTLAPINAAPSADLYYRAALSYDGVFTLYSHSRTNLDESWTVLWPVPDNICDQFVNPEVRRGSGPCGYNSICEPDQNNRPSCSCAPGFSLLDVTNQHAGCKPDYQTSQDCSPDGVVIGEDRFEFRTTQFIDWPFGDYSTVLSVNESECRQSCLLDCSCVVAILLDPVFNNGSGICWKKKLPLLNGRLNRSDASLNRKVLIKVLKSNDTGLNLPDPSKNSKGNDNNEVILILAVLLGTSAFLNFFSLAAIALVVFCLYQRKMRDFVIRPRGTELEMNLRCFSYKELESATGGFKEDLGRGAFGTVYKGEILSSSGRNMVAVKKLDRIVQEGEKEFKTEVNVIGQTHHKNLVRLLGYCNEGEHRMLVYEFMQNGSLSSLLFSKLLRPGWDQRLRIVSGIAKGLTYLHEECDSQIIHCDIKPQNILLDDSFTPKISDFGLAKLILNNKTRTMTGIRGTKGYVAPEWFRNTPVTVKVDVYSFGVMLLEMICCRKCVVFELEEEAILTEWAYECYSERMVERLVEKDEEARNDMRKVETLVKIALWCVQDEAMKRPSMRTVTMMLESVAQVPNPPSPFPFSSMSVTV